MPVFDSNTLTATTPPEGNDSRVNLALLGRGSTADIATTQFLSAQASGPSQLSASGDVAYQITGALNLNINGNFFSYTDGSEYTVIMGASTATYYGKERAWYRTLPDGDITPATYYTGINDVDPIMHPGYDPGETFMETKTVYNGSIQQYLWAGLTQVRIVDDNIQFGTPDSPIKNQATQYGNQTIVVKGSNTSTIHGDTSTVTQGDSKVLNFGSTHVAIMMGLSLTSSVGHDSGKPKSRLDAEEKQFESDESTALQGITPPPTFQEVQWGQIMPRSHALPPPMMIDNTQGLSMGLNLNAEFLSALMRNAISLVGFGARMYDLNEAQGAHLAAVLKIPIASMSAAVKKLCARVGLLFLGMLRTLLIPGPAAPEIEMDQLPVALEGEAAESSTEQLYMAAQKATQTAEEALGQSAARADSAATEAAAAAQEADNAAAEAEQAAQDAEDMEQEAQDATQEARDAAQEAQEAAQEAQEAEQNAQAAQEAKQAAQDAKQAAQDGLNNATSDNSNAAAGALSKATTTLNEATEAAQEAEQAAQEAEQEAQRAQEAAQDAANRAQNTSQTANTGSALSSQAQIDSQEAAAAAQEAAANAQAAQAAAQTINAAKEAEAAAAAAAANAPQAAAEAAAEAAAQAAAKTAAASAQGAKAATGAGVGTGAVSAVGVGMGAGGSGKNISDSQLGSGEISSESDDSGFDIDN